MVVYKDFYERLESRVSFKTKPKLYSGHLDLPANTDMLVSLGGDGTMLDAIAFRAAGTPLGDGLLAARGRTVHVAGRLRQDDWNGRIRVQLEIEDAAAPV
jgi:hypothetical protein